MSKLLADDYARFADILDWFLRQRGGREAHVDAPVARWVRSLRSIAEEKETEAVPNASNLAPGSVGSSETVASLVDLYASCATAHAIQMVEGKAAEGSLRVHFDQSFAAKELGASDAHAANVVTMPSGVGTILMAADFARSLTGSLYVFGNGSKGLDLEWHGDPRERICVEAKARSVARAFAPAADDSSLFKWARAQVSTAAAALHERCVHDGRADALRVVRLTAFLPPTVARRVHGHALTEALRGELTRLGAEAPHAVISHWFGIDAEGSDTELTSVADSLPNIIECPGPMPDPPAAAVSAFYRAVGWPLYRNRRLRSRETMEDVHRRILAALGVVA